ncbi:MAG: serine hydrolase domain-containing protein [Candidatus Aminicenantales bacterium]
MRRGKLESRFFAVIFIFVLLIFVCACSRGSDEGKSAEDVLPQHNQEEYEGYEHEYKEHKEHSEYEKEHNEYEQEHKEHTGEMEEAGPRISRDGIYDEVRKGVRLILFFDSESSSFVGSAENTTRSIIPAVRVEVHLSNGIELGPTRTVDLAPREKVNINLPAGGRSFSWWKAHAEVADHEPPLASVPPSLENEVLKDKIAQKLDLYLRRITPFGFSGALLVARKEEIILNKGYGLAVRSENVPNTRDTVFSIGSITKQFTAAGIMKLEMMGKLRTEDPITRFFDHVPPDKKSITLHHLLTHSSGVIGSTGPDYEVVSREEVVRIILRSPLQFQPGDRFFYSNAGYSLLAAVIEKVSGQSYEEFLHQHIFKAAGMNFTGYRIPDWSKKTVAHWYVGDKDNGTPLEKPYPYWHLLGNGGVLSTTEDMYRWHLALLGEKVLSPEAKKKIFTPYINDYGYGWDVLQTERGLLIQHDGGSTLGSSSEMRRYMDAGVVTILFCNQSYGEQTLMEAVRDKIEAIVFGKEVALPPEVSSIEPEELRKFDGIYRFRGGGRIEVRSSGGKLLVRPIGQEAALRLLAPGEDDVSYYKKLNSLSASIFNDFLRGKEKPLEESLFDREHRAERVKDLIRRRIRMYRKRTGEIREARSLISLPAALDGRKAVSTYVELEGQKGSIYFVLYWRGEKNVGVGPSMGPPELTIPFLPVTETEFAGYPIDSARVAKAVFKTMESGEAEAVIISGHKAERVESK